MKDSAASRSRLESLLQRLHTAYPASGIVSLAPAWKWDFGTVVGNGVQGALAFCRTTDEELVLSHEELFLPLFPDHGYLPVKEHYETVQRLVLEGRADAAQDLLRRLKQEGGFPGYNTTDPFVGACALELRMKEQNEYKDYARFVDFRSGEALTAWRDAAGLFHRRFFASRADHLIAVQLKSPVGDRLSLSVRLREIAYEVPSIPGERNLREVAVDRCEGRHSGSSLVHRMYFRRRWECQDALGCCTVARVIVQGGNCRFDGGEALIADADEVLVLIRTVPDTRVNGVCEDAELDGLAAIDADYDELLRSHTVLHSELAERCTLRLSDPAGRCRAAEDLQAASRVGDTSPALVEKAFAGGRHGIIGSTGRLPPALQGVWTGTWKPCWSGDYTLNGNVQSMVAASLTGNHFECQESLMDYLDSLMDDFRRNARELLGFRGPLIPWRSSTHGRTHYLAYRQYHHDFPGIYWFAGAAWFCQIYYDYYLHTGDTAFFEERLKPFLLESVAFYEDYLTLEQDGVYVLSPSSSPENETAPNVWMAPNATMTIAAIKELLRTLLRLRVELDADAAAAERWETMLAKLPAYQVGENGALKEWTWTGIENEEAHRHASHLYPLYYGVAPEIAESPRLQAACRVAIDQRMAPRRPENGGFMAFGLVQLGMAAAHLGDTALAYECVECLVNSYWSPVMVSQHNTGEFPDVMNMDISGGLPALVIAMLLQCDVPERAGEPWRIRLLPCLPDAWPEGDLKGTRCRGGFELDVCWEGGALESVRIKSLRGEPCRIECGERSVEVEVEAGEQVALGGDLSAE